MKGFFFTLSIISLAAALILAASLSREMRINPVPFLLSEKVSYSWEDISEDLTSATGVNSTQNGNLLDVIVELPSQANATASLNNYISFIRRFYNSTDLSVKFFSPTGEEVTDLSCFGKKQCSDNNIQFHIMPFNITYSYPDWSRKQLDVVCYQSPKDGFPACDFSQTNSINISINLNRINFTCDPSVYNNCTTSDIQWNSDFDKVFGCTSGVGCINYTLTIMDNNSRVYRCSGVYGDNSGTTKRVNCGAGTLDWYNEKEAKLTIKASPCHVDFTFGANGRFSVEGKDTNNQACDINMTVDANFNFTTSNFWTDFSTEMLVRDELANYSIRTPVR